MEAATIKNIATSIRSLSMDAIQAANSGHPGLPMGCAELGAVLYGSVIKLDPAAPEWINRDRFVLSAGHGSMLLYSLLHLSGFGVTLDEIRNFRQLGARTAGHPEHGVIPGIETTTGPLGAGFSNAVGMAIAETLLADRFNTPKQAVVDHYTYCLVGDGCLMEGIAAEAASLAGHLELGKLIVFYDSNKITIEGPTDIAFTEDVVKRFEAYGWQVLEGNGQDGEAIEALVADAKAETGRPTLIKLSTTIGFGAPNKAGSHSVHGAPLGEEEVRAARLNLGLKEDEAFYVAPEAAAHFEKRRREWTAAHDAWDSLFAAWAAENPDKKAAWDAFFNGAADTAIDFPEYKAGDKQATRVSSGKSLLSVAAALPNLVGGSADLSPSNKTDMPYGEYSAGNRGGRTFHFGVREHAMGGVMNGIALHSNFKVFGGTFLVFSDYMRPAIRLAALMKLPVIYVFTHDSIYVGEDGPTHQPIEHVAALRTIPGLTVLRPADGEETAEAWRIAVSETETPTALILTRQGLTVFEKPEGWRGGFGKGAYIVKAADGTPDGIVVATGSEVELALKAAEGKNVRVVSMPSRERFNRQDKAYRESILPAGVKTVVVEAGVAIGWEGIATSPAHVVSIDRFGESGPAAAVAAHLGLTPGAVEDALNR